MHHADSSSKAIKAKAHELGFLACGIARAEFLTEEAPRLERWLREGKQGEMGYMADHFDLRLDPRKLVPGAKSVISLAYNYFSPNKQEDPEAPKLSTYAYGRDYHKVVKQRLKPLVQFITEQFGQVELRTFVDSAPVLEKAWAQRSGVGWMGKNTNIILDPASNPPTRNPSTHNPSTHIPPTHTPPTRNPSTRNHTPTPHNPPTRNPSTRNPAPTPHNPSTRSPSTRNPLSRINVQPTGGSFFFLCEIILDLELQPDAPITDHCGTCRRCIDACPTEAITPYGVDGSKCISYFTIELKSAIPTDFAGKMANWAFGCDICQQVCPWNRFSTPHAEPQFVPKPELMGLSADDWHGMTEVVFERLFEVSAVKRTKFEGLKRNLNFLKEM